MEKQNEQLRRSTWACPMSYGIKTITEHDHDPRSRCNPLDPISSTGVVVAMPRRAYAIRPYGGLKTNPTLRVLRSLRLNRSES